MCATKPKLQKAPLTMRLLSMVLPDRLLVYKSAFKIILNCMWYPFSRVTDALALYIYGDVSACLKSK